MSDESKAEKKPWKLLRGGNQNNIEYMFMFVVYTVMRIQRQKVGVSGN